MSLSNHSVSIWKAQRKICIEDLNYLGRKENIYWIDMNFKNNNVLVLLLLSVMIFCRILQYGLIVKLHSKFHKEWRKNFKGGK